MLKSKLYLLTVASLSLLGANAYAAVPAGIDTAFQEASTDATTVIGYIAVALVSFIAAFWVIKAIRKGA